MNWEFVATSGNVCYFQYNDNSKSSSGVRFDAKYVNEGLRVVDKAPSETSKTLRDLCVNYLGLIIPGIGLGLGKVCLLIYWCVASGILISPGLDVREIHGEGEPM